MRIGNVFFEDLGWTVVKCHIDSPSPRVITAKIIGKHGFVDLSEYPTGSMMYDNRKLTFTLKKSINIQARQDEWTAISHLHGLYTTIEPNCENFYFYEGRVSLSGLEREGSIATLTITVDAKPYKLYDNEYAFDINQIDTTEHRIAVHTVPSGQEWRYVRFADNDGIIKDMTKGVRLWYANQSGTNTLLIVCDGDLYRLPTPLTSGTSYRFNWVNDSDYDADVKAMVVVKEDGEEWATL